ncbi:MAG: hypothetical protein PsegKO_33070 [Pseudohongiellaceae bacterium]
MDQQLPPDSQVIDLVWPRLHVAIAGGIGALIAMRGAPGTTCLERILNAASGAAMATFIAPPLAHWLAPGLEGGATGLGFLCGLFGMALSSGLTKGLTHLRWAEIITGWISRKPK